MSEKYDIAVPVGGSFEKLLGEKVWMPFDERATSFVDAFAEYILKEKSFRKFPELVAMAFWMRRATVTRLKEKFEIQRGDRLWLGRGLVFHIAPSNVDTIFMYSWILSMLIGNTNVVRISSRTNDQIEALLDVLNEITQRDEFQEIKKRFLVVRYEHDEEITGLFSSECSLRVIWGGDETIRRIRQVPIPPTTTEMTFADKFSMSLISAREFSVLEKTDQLITNFYNDAFWFGQNACSSPRLVVWLGSEEDVKVTREVFWKLVEKKVREKQAEFAPSVAVDKLVAESALAIESFGEVSIEPAANSLVSRVWLNDPGDVHRELHCGGGLFYEYRLDKLDELSGLITTKDQTVTVFGPKREDFTEFVKLHRPKGINRFVPIGQAMEFSTIWDGYDLLREFCREVDLAIRS
ncbi:MAG TPA: acyl-CoA reductase [candidate division Zixibacteria bacterium]|nr:acyl-CoA reductase [candidate division Zixibacteria bacterium]